MYSYYYDSFFTSLKIYSLILIVVLLLLYWFSAKEFYNIAKKKGHHEKKYFWWSFWFPPAGWAMVIALPNKADSRPQKSHMYSTELPDL